MGKILNIYDRNVLWAIFLFVCFEGKAFSLQFFFLGEKKKETSRNSYFIAKQVGPSQSPPCSLAANN